ncbi:hypothetical protein [Burkholderia gladioli]|uniref:hypothetical protein n=1 Tax=Burkholderia gladioli TaxID=28095 RepID=UPI00163EFF7C|nr:hypothetical protein [Burkholderia gladioli]
MITLGIDPGITGALAALDHNGGLRVVDMPIRPKPGNTKVRNEVNPKTLQMHLRQLVPPGEHAVVVMEALNTFAGGSVQTMGSLEATKAVISTVCELSGFAVQLVSPRTWQSFYGIKTRADADTKAQSLKLARDFYPGVHMTKTGGRPDAILIARWAQRNLT